MLERRGKPRNLKEKISYYLDNLLSRTPGYQLVGLFVFVVVIIFLGATGYFVAGGVFREQPSYGIWHAILKMYDPGTMAVDTVPGKPGDAYSVRIRLVSVFLATAGLLSLGLLIGILNTGMENKLREIRKGKTRVFETNHTVLLGWSSKIFTILQEIIFANDFGRREVVVILSEMAKETMEDEIRLRFPKLPRWLKIVCRTGRSTVPEDLEYLNVGRAASIVVIGDESAAHSAEHADSRVIKTLLAIAHHPYIHESATRIPVVAELERRVSADVAHVAAKGEALIVLRPEIVSKIMVQTARQSGLSAVYAELLSFDGNEIYVHPAKEIQGRTFGDAVFCFPGQIPIGLISRKEHTGAEEIRINPAKNQVITEHDDLILISETGEIRVDSKGVRPKPLAGIKPANQDVRKPEKLLILGWNREIHHIVMEFDKYVTQGSRIQVVAELDRAHALEIFSRQPLTLRNCSFDYRQGDPTVRRELESFEPHIYDSILLLSRVQDGGDIEAADARTIMSLLLLRDILGQGGRPLTARIVSEILDPKNQKITSVTQVNDIIISNELMSRILTQVSRQPGLLKIYEALFAEEGSEIYFKPIRLYCPQRGRVTFRDLMASALERDEIAIGLRTSQGRESGIRLNPHPVDEILEIDPRDRLVVLAENEAE